MTLHAWKFCFYCTVGKIHIKTSARNILFYIFSNWTLTNMTWYMSIRYCLLKVFYNIPPFIIHYSWLPKELCYDNNWNFGGMKTLARAMLTPTSPHWHIVNTDRIYSQSRCAFHILPLCHLCFFSLLLCAVSLQVTLIRCLYLQRDL